MRKRLCGSLAVMLCTIVIAAGTVRAGERNTKKTTDAKAEHSHNHALEFSWKRDRKLAWEDFQGPIPGDAEDITAAATFCGIGFETNTITTHNNNLQIRVYNTFYSGHSWVRPEERNEQILAHEQGHFDICELYTRMLRERLNAAKNDVNVHNLKAKFRAIYEEVQAEYKARQEAYEDETQHGVVLQEQQKWQSILARELVSSDALAIN